MISCIHTSCKNCVFATYKENLQVGCELDKLEKLKNNNAELIEATDNEKDFYVINNRICHFYRSSKWLNSIKNDPKTQVYKENKIEYAFILYINHETLLDNIQATLNNIKINKQEPTIVLLCNNKSNFKPSQLVDIMFDFHKNSNINWKIEHILSDYDKNNCIDFIIKKMNKKIQFYYACNAGENTFDCSILNDLINNQMRQTQYLKAYNNNYIISTNLHRFLSFNKGPNIIEQINIIENNRIKQNED